MFPGHMIFKVFVSKAGIVAELAFFRHVFRFVPRKNVPFAITPIGELFWAVGTLKKGFIED